MSEPLLSLREVTRRFGGTVAVDALSVDVLPDRVTSLIGPNGAGKTTVVNLIAGRLRPDAGRIVYRGAPLPDRAELVARAGIGRLFQDVRVFGSLTVLENLLAATPGLAGEGIGACLFAPRQVSRQERAAREAALSQLDLVGLTDRATAVAGSLSYGQQKLVAIARLLVQGADLLLLDEPASGVNPRLIEDLAELMARLVAAGRTILLIEHNMDLVRRASTDVILLDRGRCLAAGSVEQVWHSDALREAYAVVDEVD